MTTTSLWTLGIALCRFSCTVVVPYEWVQIVGSCLLSSNLRPFHEEFVERVWIPFFSPLLFSILIDLVRCGLSLRLFGVYCSLDSIPSIPIVAMAHGSRKLDPVFLSFGSVVPKPLYVCTYLDRSISLVLAVTTAPLRTLGMS